MAFATFSMTVHASVENLWAILADKVENPKAYTDSVDSFEITERSGTSLVRTTRTHSGDVTERINVDPNALRIDCEFLASEKYRGTTVKKITPDPDGGRPSLTFTLDWESVDGSTEEDLTPYAMAGVKHTTRFAEKRERESRPE